MAAWEETIALPLVPQPPTSHFLAERAGADTRAGFLSARFPGGKMATINLVLNLLWFVLLGFAMALGWLVAGLLLALTVIGLPWSIACFRIAAFAARMV